MSGFPDRGRYVVSGFGLTRKVSRRMVSTVGYVYIWDYVVAREHIADFERAYGPKGEWVQLFRLAPGYVRTELFRDCAQPDRFVTIDYWESRSAWEAFRAQFAERFEQIDARCGPFTLRETEIGCFESG